jgi:hypothetical protein
LPLTAWVLGNIVFLPQGHSIEALKHVTEVFELFVNQSSTLSLSQREFPRWASSSGLHSKSSTTELLWLLSNAYFSGSFIPVGHLFPTVDVCGAAPRRRFEVSLNDRRQGLSHKNTGATEATTSSRWLAAVLFSCGYFHDID